MSNRELTPAAKELIEAKKLIENPRNWVQGALRVKVRGLFGYHIKYCARGALHAVGAHRLAHHYLQDAAERLYPGHVPESVNDRIGHAETLKMFDKAISLALSGADPVLPHRRQAGGGVPTYMVIGSWTVGAATYTATQCTTKELETV